MKGCQKCGASMPFVTYNKGADLLRIRCRLCTYEWTQKPVDRGGTPGPGGISSPGAPTWVILFVAVAVTVTISILLGVN